MKYNQFSWKVIGDFKIMAFLMGFQGGFINFPCYLCLWDSRNIIFHYLYYEKKTWPLKTSYEVGAHNVKQELLGKPKKVLLPPLHIELHFIKQFVKHLDPEGETLKHILKLFQMLLETKSRQEYLWSLR